MFEKDNVSVEQVIDSYPEFFKIQKELFNEIIKKQMN